MPKIPVNEAPAGPHLDAAVAEALGWLPYESDGVWYWKDMSDDDFPYYDYHAGGYGFVEDIKPWSPSIDIAAAWELAKRHKYGRFGIGWSEDWGVPYCIIGDIYEYAETAPLAICRAFLKANGVTHVEISDGI